MSFTDAIDIRRRYCEHCGRETPHRYYKKSGFITNLFTAIIVNFTADLRDPKVRCLVCSKVTM